MSRNDMIIAGLVLAWVAYGAGRQRGYAEGVTAQRGLGIGGALDWLQGWTVQ